MIFDNNYDKFGNKTDDNGNTVNQPLIGEYPDLSNETVNPVIISGGTSKNYQTGTAGWQITPDGNCEFNNGNFRGNITGANGVFSGTISADNVTAGTLVGSTVKAVGSGSGTDVWISNDGKLKFFYGGNQYGSIYMDSSYNILYNANTSHQFFNIDTSIQFAQFNTDGITLPSGKKVQFSGGTYLQDTGSAIVLGESGKNFLPSSDKSGGLGQGSPQKRWDNLYVYNDPVIGSDERNKLNKQEISYGLDAISSLNPLQYDRDDKHTIGLTAQDLYEIIPEAVFKPEDENEDWGIQYTKLIPVLIKAVQEQQQQIIDLQSKIN